MATNGPKPGSEAGFLSAFPTFEGFSSRDLQKIVRKADRVSLPANWGLIHERTPGDACYIVLDGRVAVYADREQVAELGPGEVVGEMALREGRLRSATVSTKEPVELLRIEGADFTELTTEVPALRRALDKAVVRHGGAASED